MIEPEYPTEWDQELDITRIQKQNWKSKESREKWKDSLNRCWESFDELEILDVSSNSERDVCVIDRGKLRNPKFVNLLASEGLRVEVEHKHAFVAEDEDDAELAIEAFNEDNHKLMGEMFGYPECCVDFFIESVDSVHKPPIYEIACKSDNAEKYPNSQSILLNDPDPMINVIWQYLGYAFINHIPCSFDCEASSQIAIHHGELFRELGLGNEAEDLWEFLDTPVTWTGYHGLSNIRNGYMIGSTNTPEYWDKKTVVWKQEHEKKIL